MPTKKKYKIEKAKKICLIGPNRFSSPIGGYREMDQLYMTSQVSNITKENKCFPSVKCKNRN